MLADRYGLSLSTSSQPRRPELWREVHDFVSEGSSRLCRRSPRCCLRRDGRFRRATVNVAGFSAEPTLQ